MGAGGAPGGGVAQDPNQALHAVWFTVLKPNRIVLPNGAPGFEMVHQAETLAEATTYVAQVPGGMIVANVVVFVNPRMAPVKPS